MKEAEKLGFASAIVPSRTKAGDGTSMQTRPMDDLVGFVGEFFGAG
jgi:DNA repair protein RadA/Sms